MLLFQLPHLFQQLAFLSDFCEYPSPHGFEISLKQLILDEVAFLALIAMANLIKPLADALAATKGVIACLMSATTLGQPHECFLLLLADLYLPDEFTVDLCKFPLE